MRRLLSILAVLLGIALVLLGGLWLVQGLGLVAIDPIACAGDCETLDGPSAGWAAAGAALVVAGAALALVGIRRR